MEIKKTDNKFYIGEDVNNPKAELDYKFKSDNVIEAYHTLVKPELEGQGIAGKLFNELIDFAKKEDLKIIPSCSYVERKMEGKPEYKDLLAGN